MANDAGLKGSVEDGVISLTDDYLGGAAADIDHQQVLVIAPAGDTPEIREVCLLIPADHPRL